jgi:hypothetical protein
MAFDVRARADTVSKWWQRDSIPSSLWSSILATDKAKSAGVSPSVFVELAARENTEIRS